MPIDAFTRDTKTVTTGKSSIGNTNFFTKFGLFTINVGALINTSVKLFKTTNPATILTHNRECFLQTPNVL